MVWWARTIALDLDMPDEVMGLVFFAIGISIPDLVTGIAVSRVGQASDAASSFLGSKIFDMLLALGLPWFFYGVTHDTSIDASADFLFISLIILILIVGVFLILLKLLSWKINKYLAVLMLLGYGAFLMQHLVRAWT